MDISTESKIAIYIDTSNLHRAASSLGFSIDYIQFRHWLRQKYSIHKAYLFIGFIPEKENFYTYLKEVGFILIFKKIISVKGVTKGNCDAELVLKAVSDFYIKDFDECLLVTGDGDFGCLIEFLRDNSALKEILAPNKNKCSFLIKNKKVPITFLNEHYHKFSRKKI